MPTDPAQLAADRQLVADLFEAAPRLPVEALDFLIYLDSVRAMNWPLTDQDRKTAERILAEKG
jgi:hypothetical protein